MDNQCSAAPLRITFQTVFRAPQEQSIGNESKNTKLLVKARQNLPNKIKEYGL